MSRRTRRAVAAILIVAALSLLLSKFWVFTGMEGRVVSKESGKPVRDAIVVANWQQKGLEGYPTGQVMVFETTTDADGVFHLPGWMRLGVRSGDVGNDQPIVRIFHEGYLPLILMNTMPGSPVDTSDAGIVIRSKLDGATLPLESFRGSLVDQSFAIDKWLASLRVLLDGSECEWTGIPRTIRKLDEMKNGLDGAGNAINLPSLKWYVDSGRCPDSARIFSKNL